jgi:rhodanese-related sulfurtransferase
VSPRKPVDELLADAAVRLGRLSPVEAWAEMRAGAILVDTRSPDQRQAQGYVPGSVHHPLSTLLWRLDPDCPTSNEKIPLDARVILICREGYSSVLAAAQLQEIGFEDATDVIGGVEDWKKAGLPVLWQANQTVVETDEAVARSRGDRLSIQLGRRSRPLRDESKRLRAQLPEGALEAALLAQRLVTAAA